MSGVEYIVVLVLFLHDFGVNWNDALVFSQQILLIQLQSCCNGNECYYHILILKDTLVCVLKTNFVVIERFCKVFYFILDLLLLSFWKRDLFVRKDARSHSRRNRENWILFCEKRLVQ